MSREATERRLRAAGFARLEPDEQIVIWCRAWVSKIGRFQRFAPRWRDVAVLTDRRLLLFGVGHFTRRPRRRVLADRLDELAVADVGLHPGRGLQCSRPGRSPMLIELGSDPWSRKVGQELQERAGRQPQAVADPPPVLGPAPAEEPVAAIETPPAVDGPAEEPVATPPAVDEPVEVATETEAAVPEEAPAAEATPVGGAPVAEAAAPGPPDESPLP
ncbi:MAG TPA: hypothetical protein VIK61_06100 [Acidimicrobiia bacterium]